MHRIARSRGFPHNSLESCVSYPMPNLLKICHSNCCYVVAQHLLVDADYLLADYCFLLLDDAIADQALLLVAAVVAARELVVEEAQN